METIVAISLSALWICSPCTCVYKSGPQPSKDSRLSNPPFHESITSSASRLTESNYPRRRYSRSWNGAVLAGRHASNFVSLPPIRCTYKPPNACNDHATPPYPLF
ncbi:hypothetical protein EDD85DRAFT_2828 [Armillaria nabsnona]|nr:hypothetical protein EDD85DRAFT_2828 [Armillaria nabsnona]